MTHRIDNEPFQQWLAQVNQVCGSFSARQLDGEFIGELETDHSRGMKLSTVTTANVNMYRTRDDIGRSNDEWFYTVFQLGGRTVVEQDEHQIVIGAGDITLIDASRPSTLYWQERSRQVSLLLPRHLLESQVRFAEVASAACLSHTQPIVQLSHRLLLESMASQALSLAESEAALEALVCLLRPMLLQRETKPSRRDRQFEKVVALIDDHIQSETLRPEWLANETGMSVRSLYRMFADKGLVVAQYIKNRRLDFCAQALRHAQNDEKLAGIGYNWGFADHSHFSTAFRQRFGVSPGEYRKRYR